MSISFTARQWITRSLISIGHLAPGEPLKAEDAETGFELAQELIDNWNTQALTVLSNKRTVYDLVAGRGGPNDPYLIGPGATGTNFNTGTDERPLLIRTANLLNNSNPVQPFEMNLPVITDDGFAATAIKSLSTTLQTQLYYNPTVPLGSIILWPIPNTAANDLVLYTDLLPQQVFTLDDVYVCPSGAVGALRLGLAAKMLVPFAAPPEMWAKVEKEAAQALSDFKAPNAKMADLSMDVAFTPNPSGNYNIYTDQGA